MIVKSIEKLEPRKKDTQREREINNNMESIMEALPKNYIWIIVGFDFKFIALAIVTGEQ
jgi:hypothetical protein